MSLTASGILYETLHAYRAHTWVDLGAHLMHPIMAPPAPGVLFSLLIFAIAVFCFW